MKLFWTRLISTREHLRQTFCLKGEHWMTWWRWFDDIALPGNIHSISGWFRRCRVCGGKVEHHARYTKRPFPLWPFRVTLK